LKNGILGKSFGGFLEKNGFIGVKTHSGHCGTIENGQKAGYFFTFFHVFSHFLTTFSHFFITFQHFFMLFWPHISRLNNSCTPGGRPEPVREHSLRKAVGLKIKRKTRTNR
jgi:hypothetical protein